MVEHVTFNHGVRSSSLRWSTRLLSAPITARLNKKPPLAQLVEHLTLNQGVRSSSLRRRTRKRTEYLNGVPSVFFNRHRARKAAPYGEEFCFYGKFMTARRAFIVFRFLSGYHRVNTATTTTPAIRHSANTICKIPFIISNSLYFISATGWTSVSAKLASLFFLPSIAFLF